MKVNAKELNMLYEKVLKSVNGDNTVATMLINTVGGDGARRFFKPNHSKEYLRFKGEKGRLYHYFAGDSKAVKLNDQILGRYDITYDTLLFFRKYLGEDFRPTYLNVNDLYKIASRIYELNKLLCPGFTTCTNMVLAITMINTCDSKDYRILKEVDKTRLSIGCGKNDGRIYQTLYTYDDILEEYVRSSEDMFVSNSTLRKFPLSKEGESFVYKWLNML